MSIEQDNWLNAYATTYQLDALAADIGRLRRRLPEGDYNEWLLECISGRVLTLDAVLQPTAGELARTVPVQEALRVVDQRAHRLSCLLGEAAR